MPRWPSSSATPADSPTARLPDDAGPVLLGLARAAISAELGVPRSVDASAQWLQHDGACFVTLTRDGRLRGCIGSVEARRPLGRDVVENALAAAFEDRRFRPLDRRELADTDIEVSVLSPLSPLRFADEAHALAQLRPGTDGVVLELGELRATFLPQVWDKVPDPGAFLAHLKAKAGLPAAYWSDEVRLSRYTVTEFHEER